jgi:hypothetical protein
MLSWGEVILSFINKACNYRIPSLNKVIFKNQGKHNADSNRQYQ